MVEGPHISEQIYTRKHKKVLPVTFLVLLSILTVFSGVYLFIKINFKGGGVERINTVSKEQNAIEKLQSELEAVKKENEQLKNLAASGEPESKTTWTLPKSTKRGFPILDKTNDQLLIYTFDDKKLRKVPGATSLGYAGTLGFGDTEPTPSPNFLYTLFVNKESNDLQIISNQTLNMKTIPGSNGASYISGWSPDSKRLIFYIPEDTILSRRDGPTPWEGVAAFDQSRADSGFFLFNIESGERKKIYPVDYFVSFIDLSKILVRAKSDSSRLVVFNLDTFEADYSYVKGEYGFGTLQFNFSQDGRKWAFKLSKNPTNDSNIIYANFPKKEGEELDSGTWAEVQWPKVSPNGNKVAYERSKGSQELGVYIYDATSKTTRQYAAGKPEHWLDEDNLIVSKEDEGEYYLLTVSSEAIEKFY